MREEQLADHEQVAAVQRAAFGAQGAAVAALVNDLRASVASDGGLSLVATDEDDQVVGHALFTRSLLDAPTRLVDVQVLSPLGVLPEQQGRGIGSALVRSGLELLAGRDVPLVFLEGSPAYYSRFGFSPGADYDFRRPSLRIPPAGFQVRLLPAYEPWMTGTLVYRQEFWHHDLVGLRDGPRVGK
jgi:putative acetyltransferase